MNGPGMLRYRVVDVFTQRALEGNALAVFPEAAGVDEELMGRIAREMNLSETVFVQPCERGTGRAECAARVRIFTPSKELPFAGHPTVGAAWVLLEEQLVGWGLDRFALEEGVGPVAVRAEYGDGGRRLIWLRTPGMTFGRRFEAGACAEALGLERGDLLEAEPQVVSAGNPFLFVAVKDRAAVDRAGLEMAGLRRIRASARERAEGETAEDEGAGVFVFAPVEEGAYSRMFAPELGIVEDPATGSATGPLAAFMMRQGMVSAAAGTRFVSEQGTKMGRRSLLHVLVTEDGGVEVGGYVTPVAEGRMGW